jgi:hypothetical protein
MNQSDLPIEIRFSRSSPELWEYWRYFASSSSCSGYGKLLFLIGYQQRELFYEQSDGNDQSRHEQAKDDSPELSARFQRQKTVLLSMWAAVYLCLYTWIKFHSNLSYSFRTIKKFANSEKTSLQ